MPESPAGVATRPDDALYSSVARLVKVGACSSPSFSPDGERVAFISNLSGMPQVWTVPLRGGWPDMVTAFDDPVTGVHWSPRGDLLAVAVAPGGGMNQQIYFLEPDGLGARITTLGGHDNNWLGAWLRDGSGYVFSSNRDHPDRMQLYLAKVGGEIRLLSPNPGVARVSSVSADGRYAIVEQTEYRGDNNVHRLDLASGIETVLTPHQPPASFLYGHLSPDNGTLYLCTDADRDLMAFGRISIAPDGEPGPFEIVRARDDAEAEGLEVTRDGKLAAVRWNASGKSEVSLIELEAGVSRALPLPAEISLGEWFSGDGRYLALVLSGATAPLDIWIHDVEAVETTQLTHSQHAGIRLDTLTRPELVRFAAHDGLGLSAWLYRPAGSSGPFATVIDFHGGPEAQARPFFNSTYQALLGEGIAVLAPNVRGSTGFGKRFVNLDNGPLRFDAVRDIAACVRAVIDLDLADPDRIGIMGGSYGGYMTMAGLVEYPEIFAAGANLYGIVNFDTFFRDTEPWMAAISKQEYGDPDTEADLLRRLSPIHRIDKVRAPTLVVHGANDTNVPVVEAEQVVENLRRRDIPVEYVLFPDEGHGFRKLTNRVRSTVSIVSWFARYL
jgi:dipeptidyl aminopeptidase/acylaminoacyl peptidase